MKHKLYTNKQLLEITGEKRSRIQYWILKGVFQPADLGTGVGTSRHYSFANLLEVTLAQEMSALLHNVDFITKVINEVRTKYPKFFEKPSKYQKITGKNLLSVGYFSKLSNITSILNQKETNKALNKLTSKGFKFFAMDLDVAKAELIQKINNLGLD